MAGALAAGVLAIAVVLVDGSVAAYASSPTATSVATAVRQLRSRPTVPSGVRKEVARVKSPGDLRRVSARARELIRTPVVEETATQRIEPPATYGSGGKALGRGCYDVWVTRTRRNVFGWTLTSARTEIRNWCNDGRRITSSPTVVRSQQGHWGWATCGWNGAYRGWLRSRTRYGAGGYALFALGDSCFAPQVQLRNELQVFGDGRYYWWN
jgi:hypothetical protein